MKVKKLTMIIAFALIAIFIPLIIYYIHFGFNSLSDNFSNWNTFSNYYSGFITPYISLLTLIVTVFIAYNLNQYEVRKDKALKRQDDVKSYLELYQFFSSSEFREKRHIAWGVLTSALRNKSYADYIIKETFIGRYTDRTPREEIYKNCKMIYKDPSLTQSHFFKKEVEDRHILEAVIDFFQFLAIKDIPAENYKVCDFYYDSWRPLLCWYAKQAELGYEKYEGNKEFSNPPNLRKSIELLDAKYYHPPAEKHLSPDTIDQHPLIIYQSDRKQ